MENLLLQALETGLTLNGAVQPDDNRIALMMSGEIYPLDSQLLAGYVHELQARFPGAPVWGSENGMLLLETLALPVEGAAIENDFLVGQFAATGNLDLLRELVRRAKHRDGSADSIAIGTPALILLSEASSQSETLGMLLAANGFAANAVTFGAFPAGTESAFKPVGRPVVPPIAPAAIAPTATTDDARSTPAPAPAVVIPIAPRATVAGVVAADLATGAVFMGATKLSVSEAHKLSDDLTIAARQLLLPVEGYAWIDDMRDPQRLTSLVCADLYISSGLADTDLGGVLRAIVAQTPNDKFTFTLYQRDGSSSNGGPFDSQDAAQVVVAGKVRELMAAAGNNPENCK